MQNEHWRDASLEVPEISADCDLFWNQSSPVKALCADGLERLACYRVYKTGIEPDWRTADSNQWFVDVKKWRYL